MAIMPTPTAFHPEVSSLHASQEVLDAGDPPEPLLGNGASKTPRTIAPNVFLYVCALGASFRRAVAMPSALGESRDR
eukprot:156715-Pyramimonas_sp.AAC.1